MMIAVVTRNVDHRILRNLLAGLRCGQRIKFRSDSIHRRLDDRCHTGDGESLIQQLIQVRLYRGEGVRHQLAVFRRELAEEPGQLVKL